MSKMDKDWIARNASIGAKASPDSPLYAAGTASTEAVKNYCEADLAATLAITKHHQAQYSPAVSVLVPALDGDRIAYERHGHALSTWGRRERRIVANLISHLNAHGFMIVAVDDGGDDEEVITDNNMKDAMESAFAVDEATLIFADPASGTKYVVDLIFNNGNDGLDVISDHSTGGRFGPAMDSFDAEVWA